MKKLVGIVVSDDEVLVVLDDVGLEAASKSTFRVGKVSLVVEGQTGQDPGMLVLDLLGGRLRVGHDGHSSVDFAAY